MGVDVVMYCYYRLFISLGGLVDLLLALGEADPNATAKNIPLITLLVAYRGSLSLSGKCSSIPIRGLSRVKHTKDRVDSEIPHLVVYRVRPTIIFTISANPNV